MATSTVSLQTPPEILLLQRCTELQEVRQLHARIVVTGLISHYKIASRRLIQAYVKTRNVVPAITLLETSSPDVFAYNTIIRGLLISHDDSPARALLYYNQFLLQAHQPDNYTYTFVLKACSRLLHHSKALSVGKQIHGRIIKAGIPPDTYVHSSLIQMYASSGCMDDAERVLSEFGDQENVDATNSIISGYCRCGRVYEARAKFDSMRVRDVASWSAMITGYTRNEMHVEALSLFHCMIVIDPNILPNESMLVSLFTACGSIGALAQGRWIHKYIDRVVGMKNTPNLSTAIVNMYAKCGSIECSYRMFRKIAKRDRDVVSWGAMISGFAIHGQAVKCLQLFDEMIGCGIQPNVVIFVAVLSACSRSGLVQKGQYYFQEMVHRFKITPTIEHYGCMVDMLARAGRLEEARKLIESMPEQPNSVIIRSFLSGCRMHNDIARGSWAFRKLMEIEPVSGDRYKMGELMFASTGRQKEATKIKMLMDAAGKERTAGCSFIEVDGTVHEFMAGDIMHSKTEEIYRMCSSVNTTIRSAHY